MAYKGQPNQILFLQDIFLSQIKIMSDSQFKKFNFHKDLLIFVLRRGITRKLFNYSTAIEYCSDGQKKAFATGGVVYQRFTNLMILRVQMRG